MNIALTSLARDLVIYILPYIDYKQMIKTLNLDDLRPEGLMSKLQGKSRILQ